MDNGNSVRERWDNREALREFYHVLWDHLGDGVARVVMRLHSQYLGGLRVRFPTFEELDREERNRQIRLRFTGDNHHELAEMFRISVRQVRRILMER